jgi:hypothetical protein
VQNDAPVHAQNRGLTQLNIQVELNVQQHYLTLAALQIWNDHIQDALHSLQFMEYLGCR